ncbi:hypothetical protein J2W94_000828 [Pseudoxanthomonas sacheonensis]|uniref:Uncharacterized protein n=1 Tax=Pseudoxanthomonas sacheonensis TaxID=443615 RepID=A0ABU1RP60_9GAMM|nr:hypothetical protein [Pseudoxanthomonas sacheonensis]
MTGQKPRLQTVKRLRALAFFGFSCMFIVAFGFDAPGTNWIDYLLIGLFLITVVLSFLSAGHAFDYLHRWWMLRK